jgi:cell division septation protein DedD
MHEDFENGDLEPVEHRRDTELTLGPAMLLGLFFGLVLLCGLSFGLGYSMGSHGAHTATSVPLPAAAPVASSSVATPKPSAAPLKTAPPPPADSSAAAAETVPAESAAPPVAATPTTGSLMVQIAALSHQEDADVLVGALRKRGYAVASTRDLADGQFHVRIGPFATRNEANTTRQKLLKDGYNAIVQP